ncbi:hypothetical protein ACQKWADRAFT_299423 [Trichoderma austrokoningii]
MATQATSEQQLPTRQKGHRQLQDIPAKPHQKLKIATAQVHTAHDSRRALDVLETRVRELSAEDVDLVLLSEVFVGGLPRLSTLGNSAIGTFGDEILVLCLISRLSFP